MGADEIIKKIDERASAEVDKIIQDANTRREKILDEARREAEHKKQVILERGEKEAILEKQRILADAKLKARRLRWDAQEDLVSQVLDAARNKVSKVRDDPKYGDILKVLIQEAASSIGEDELEVLLADGDSVDLEQISGELGIKLSLSDKKISGMGGVIVRTRDGRIEVDNTFERRMERFTELLRTEITATLFGGV
ncbi:MAG: V-type ATP synthase subunit E family protein [Candidatus Syntrophoarchaeum sp.]|nr:V-type ATP synthase subunit E family protein [Candidatus Syntrophoarchaeum sp.]